MIQIITANKNQYRASSSKLLVGKEIFISDLGSPRSLDEFEINIIDAACGDIWINDEKNTTSINSIGDFISLSEMIASSQLAKNIIIYPQNFDYKYNYQLYTFEYYTIKLKDILSGLMEIMSTLTSDTNMIYYENTRTKLCNEEVEAAFYFHPAETRHHMALTNSIKSNKITTLSLSFSENDNDLVVTTLSLNSIEKLDAFLREIRFLEDKELSPEWVKEITMFDDEQLNQTICEKQLIIEAAKSDIKLAQEGLEINNHFKSILYTNGDELVKVVFEILQEMLSCNLSEFVDIKQEDFSFVTEDKHLIGEIKGINTNVKSSNISQLDVHYQNYLESNQVDKNDVKAILIVNHQRSKPLKQREPVHEEQIKLAHRNGSLIVETPVLLKLFQDYKKGCYTQGQCRQLLLETVGILR